MDKSCENCYYRSFKSESYPCSRCIRNAPSEDMWRWQNDSVNGMISKLRSLGYEVKKINDKSNSTSIKEQYAKDIKEYIFFQCKENQLIYPGIISKALSIPMTDVYEVLEKCSDEGIITSNLEAYCPHCKKITGCVYATAAEIPDDVICPLCGEKIANPISVAIVIYRKCG